MLLPLFTPPPFLRHTTTACAAPSVTVRRRRADYFQTPEPRGHVEPAVVHIVPIVHGRRSSADAVRSAVRAAASSEEGARDGVAVVVELCRARAGVMYGGESDAASEGGWKLGLLKALLKAGGGVEGIEGAEWRAAAEVAREVGAEVVLGDRPLRVTIGRLWGVLGGLERASIIGAVMRGYFLGGMGRKGVEVGGGAGEVAEFLDFFAKKCPDGYEVLVGERDRFLTWTLKRSKAVSGKGVVVGVVGAAHLPGVLDAFDGDDMDRRDGGKGLRFKDLI